MDRATTGAIVLAGGRSSRFGSDKLATPVRGRPLLDHAVDAVRSVASDVVVVTSPGLGRVVPTGVRTIEDDRVFEGPLVGLAAGLEAFARPARAIIVVGGDMPDLVPAVLATLIDALAGASDAAILGTVGQRAILPMALIHPVQVARARRLVDAGERRLGALLDVSVVTVVPHAAWTAVDPTERTLRDIDLRSDVADEP